MQKHMIEVFDKLAELPVTVAQHNCLFLGITVMTARLQQLYLHQQHSSLNHGSHWHKNYRWVLFSVHIH